MDTSVETEVESSEGHTFVNINQSELEVYSISVNTANLPQDERDYTRALANEPKSQGTCAKPRTISTISSSIPFPVLIHSDEESGGRLEPESLVGNHKSVPSTSTDERVCRICQDTTDEKGRTKLVSPCGCSGSAEFTHKKCLRKWSTVKGATTCEICQKGYDPKYMKFRDKEKIRQGLCLGSAASLPLIIIMIVGFSLLGEELRFGHLPRDEGELTNDENDELTGVGKISVAICMISAGLMGVLCLCCFSVRVAKGHADVSGSVWGPQQNDAHRSHVPIYFY